MLCLVGNKDGLVAGWLLGERLDSNSCVTPCKVEAPKIGSICLRTSEKHIMTYLLSTHIFIRV